MTNNLSSPFTNEGVWMVSTYMKTSSSVIREIKIEMSNKYLYQFIKMPKIKKTNSPYKVLERIQSN